MEGNRPLSRSGHVEFPENKGLFIARLDVQNVLFLC